MCSLGLLTPKWDEASNCSLSSGFEPENRRVQRLGSAHRIKIFPEERDLPVGSTQKHDIILAIHTARRLDDPFAFDLSDCALRIGQGMHFEVKEAEVLHSTDEPGCVSYRFLSA